MDAFGVLAVMPHGLGEPLADSLETILERRQSDVDHRLDVCRLGRWLRAAHVAPVALHISRYPDRIGGQIRGRHCRRFGMQEPPIEYDVAREPTAREQP